MIRTLRAYLLPYLVALLAAATTCLALAQDAAVDVEPPNIQDETTIDGTPWRSAVVVTDNDTIRSVSLSYREQGETMYDIVTMTDSYDSGEYSVVLDQSISEGVVEYYYEAVDESGNIALQGFAFSPLSRSLAPPSVVDPPPPTPNRRQVLYYGLGTLAFVVVIAAIVKDSDSSNTSPRDRVTVSLPVP